jgi:hypothetical protein
MVWMDVEGDELLFNTAEGRRKPDNIRRDPRVIVSVQIATTRKRTRSSTAEGESPRLGPTLTLTSWPNVFSGLDRYPYRRPTERND